MRILYITKHNPWGIGGGSAASRMYLEVFRKVFCNAKIDLCINKNIPLHEIPKDIIDDANITIFRVESRSAISRLVSPLTGITHRFQEFAIHLLHHNDYTYCIFDHSSIAGTLVNHVKKGINTIVIHHNYEPDYFKDNTPSFFLRNLLIPTVRRCERNAFKKCNINIFLTEEDKKQFEVNYGDNNKNNIVTGLFETNPGVRPNPVSTLKLETPTILITGSLSNVQNTDGIRYFITDLYPLISQDYKIIIAGRNPNEEIQNLIKGKNNIKLIPNPPVMSDIIAKGNIFLSPARLGGGIKVRVTDGLKSGLPVIAHRTSTRGYAPYIEKGYLKSFSTPADFKIALEKIIEEINMEVYTSLEIADFYYSISSAEKVIQTIQSCMNNEFF